MGAGLREMEAVVAAVLIMAEIRIIQGLFLILNMEEAFLKYYFQGLIKKRQNQ